jgi:hypothetical protein
LENKLFVGCDRHTLGGSFFELSLQGLLFILSGNKENEHLSTCDYSVGSLPSIMGS